MYRDINSDLVRGNIDTIILKALSTGERYGIEIAAVIEASCNNQYIIKQPTLYSCLNRLEKQGLTESYWKNSDFGGRRRYYNLTEKGHKTLKDYKKEWAYSRTVLDHLITADVDNIDLYAKKQSEVVKENIAVENTETKTVSNVVENNTFLPYNTEGMSTRVIVKQEEEIKENLDTKDDAILLKQQTTGNAVQLQMNTEQTIVKNPAPLLTGRVSHPELFGTSFAASMQQLNTLHSNPYLKTKKPTQQVFKNNIQTDENINKEEFDETEEILKDQEETQKNENVESDAIIVKERLSSNDLIANTKGDPNRFLKYNTNNANYTPLYSNQNTSLNAPFNENINISFDQIQIKQSQKISENVNTTQFVQINKLKFYQSLFISFFIIALTLVVYYAISSKYPINELGQSVYIFAIALAAWFIVFRGILYFVTPNQTKELSVHYTSLILIKLFATILTLALVFSLNVFLGFSTLNDIEFYSTLLLPAVLTIAYPMATFVFYLLIKSKKFFA